MDGIAKVYRQRRDDLADYAASITGDSDSADDVVQAAWLRLDRNPRGHAVHDAVGYLFRTVRNLAIDRLRSGRREGKRYGGDVADIATALPDEAPSPETAAIMRDELARVQAALDELPERTRTAIRLHRVEGLPLREVAEQIGLSVTRTHELIVEGIAHCDRRRSSAGQGGRRAGR